MITYYTNKYNKITLKNSNFYPIRDFSSTNNLLGKGKGKRKAIKAENDQEKLLNDIFAERCQEVRNDIVLIKSSSKSTEEYLNKLEEKNQELQKIYDNTPDHQEARIIAGLMNEYNLAKHRDTNVSLDWDKIDKSDSKDEPKDTKDDEPKGSQGPSSMGGIGSSSPSIFSGGVGPSISERKDLDVKEKFIYWIFFIIEPMLEPTLEILKNIYF